MELLVVKYVHNKRNKCSDNLLKFTYNAIFFLYIADNFSFYKSYFENGSTLIPQKFGIIGHKSKRMVPHWV